MGDKSKNVTSAEELRSMYKEPSVVAQEKVLQSWTNIARR